MPPTPHPAGRPSAPTAGGVVLDRLLRVVSPTHGSRRNADAALQALTATVAERRAAAVLLATASPRRDTGARDDEPVRQARATGVRRP
jgi:hypothetical protein